MPERTNRRSAARFLLACTLVAGFVPASGLNSGATAAPGQPDVVIVGDSLTGGNTSFIGPTLRNAGLDVRLEALSARRIAVSYQFLGPRDSGVARVRALKAAGVAPELWLIQLGTNDLGAVQNCRCPDPIAFAGDIIDQLLDEIGTGVPIAWVTLLNQSQEDATRWFNHAISIRAARDPYMALVDWRAITVNRPDLFLDDVHPNVAGVVVLTQMYIDHISALLADPLGPHTPGPGLASAERIGSFEH